MPVQCRAMHAQLPGGGRDGHARPHEGAGSLDRFRRAHHGPAALTAPGRSCGEAVTGALPDEVTLELTNRAEHVEHEPAARRRRVDALIQDHEISTLPGEVSGQVDEVRHRPGQSVQPGGHQNVAGAQVIQQSRELAAVPVSTGRDVRPDPGAPGRLERVVLPVETLTGGRDAGVPKTMRSHDSSVA